MKPIGKTERYTLSKIVVESIKQYILDNGLSPGDRLPSERDLCKMMNISRTILREALHSLESIGILEIRHGEGSYVAHQFLQPVSENLNFALQMKGTNPQEMLEVRFMLETVALDQLTSEPPLQVDLEKALALSDQGDDAGFHLQLIRTVQNSSFEKLCEPFIHNFPSDPFSEKSSQQIAEEHQAYIHAIKSGERELAKQKLRIHLGLA